MGQTSSKGKEEALITVFTLDTDVIGSVEIVEAIPQPASIYHVIEGLFNSLHSESKYSEKAEVKLASTLESQSKTTTKIDYPSEPRQILKVEKRRAAETAAILALGSAAINGVEITLLPLTNGSNRQFVDSMKIYLHAAIAQYMALVSASKSGEPLQRDPVVRYDSLRVYLLSERGGYWQFQQRLTCKGT